MNTNKQVKMHGKARGIAGPSGDLGMTRRQALSAPHSGERRSHTAAGLALLMVGLCSESVVQAQGLPPAPISAPAVVQHEYDAEGRPTKRTQNPAGLKLSTQQGYDALSRLTQIIDPAQGRSTLKYDGLDRLLELQDPRRLSTEYRRNGLGDLLQLRSPDTGVETATNNAAGHLLTSTDSRGYLSSYSYDALQRLSKVSVKHPSDGSVRSTEWIYDQNDGEHGYGVGRLTTAKNRETELRWGYDQQGRIVRLATSLGRFMPSLDVAYAYDASNRIQRIRYPSGRLVEYQHQGGLLRSVALLADEDAPAQTLIDEVKTSPFGPVQSWTWQLSGAPRKHVRELDKSGRLVRYPLGDWVRDLGYDAADRIISYTHYDALSGAPHPQLDQRFAYDDAGRLKSASSATSTWTYSYDANGNRTLASSTSGGSRNYSIAADSNRLNSISQPLRSFGYDAAGNTISDQGQAGSSYTAIYNHEGRLASLSAGNRVMTSVYDALGQRVSRRTSANAGAVATSSHFAYDLQGRLLGEYSINAGQIRAVVEYIWLDEQPLAAVRPRVGATADAPNSEQEVFALHSDHLGTPRVALDTAGRLRWRWMGGEPFGVNPAENNPEGLGELNLSLRLPGQQYDGFVGLHYNYFRDYDPTVGRYVQSDPIGLQGGVNTFAYVGGNPLSYADPFGLKSRHDPNSRVCQDHKTKISNYKTDINKRIRELAENPANLPYYPPYPGAPPRASQQGHEELIRDLREKLTDREKKYKNDCEDSDPPPPSPPPEPICGENCKRVLKAVRDTVTGAIIFTFVLVCATS